MRHGRFSFSSRPLPARRRQCAMRHARFFCAIFLSARRSSDVINTNERKNQSQNSKRFPSKKCAPVGAFQKGENELPPTLPPSNE